MTMNFFCPFQKQDICNNIPDVTYKTSWHAGGTGYIDGIRPSDEVFANGPLVKFVDEYQRSAIAIKYTVSCPEDTKENGEYAVAAFQRYSDSTKTWVYGGHHAHNGATSVGQIYPFTWLESFILNKEEKFTNHFYIKNDAGGHDKIVEECLVTLVQNDPIQNPNYEL